MGLQSVGIISAGYHPHEIGSRVPQLEGYGIDTIWSIEMEHDPFILAALAGSASKSCRVGTGVAVALARNPYSVAVMSHDLQDLTNERFVLGIGSQIQAHITKRFSMPWYGNAVESLRDFLLAFNAIWDSWESGKRLNYRGSFYRHTLSAPTFVPNPVLRRPPIIFGGQQSHMIRLAGSMGSGYISHPFGCKHLLDQSIVPLLNEARSTRPAGTAAPFEIIQSLPVIIDEGNNESHRAKEEMRLRVAFFASTPAYKHVMEHHGWSDTHEALLNLSILRKWAEMKACITDEMLHEFVVIADARSLLSALTAKISGSATSVALIGTNFWNEDRLGLLTDISQSLKQT